MKIEASVMVAALRRRYRLNHKGPRLLYLSAIPEHRQKGWLWDWNEEWGRTIKRGRHERPMKLIGQLTWGRRDPRVMYFHPTPKNRMGRWLAKPDDPIILFGSYKPE